MSGITIEIADLVVDLPPHLEVDREEFTKGLVEELTRLLQRQDLPSAAIHDLELVSVESRADAHTSAGAGQEAARALHRGLTQWR